MPITLDENNGRLLGLLTHQSAAGELLGSPIAVQPLDCGVLREARRTGNQTAIQGVVDTNFFAIENVRRWAARIGWHGQPLDFSYWTLDGSRWYGTGQPFPDYGPADVDPNWPCSATYRTAAGLPPPTCGAGGLDAGSLFCASPLNCSDRLQRAVRNHRFARAAIVLATLSGTGLANLRLPVRYGIGPEYVDEVTGEYTGQTIVAQYGTAPAPVWRIATSLRFENLEKSGLLAIPMTNETEVVWHRVSDESESVFWPHGSTSDWPVAFVNLGAQQGYPTTARRVAPAFWAGMSQGASSDLYDVDFLSEGLFDTDVLATVQLPGEMLQNADGSKGIFRLALERTGNPRMIAGRQAWSRNAAITDYWKEHAYALNSAPDGGAAFQDNQLHIASSGFYRRDLLDAMELMCEGARSAATGAHCDPSRPPALHTPDDIPAFRAYLYCLADRVQRIGETMILQNVPQRVIDIIRGNPTTIRPDVGAHGDAT
ncbi:MAG: hypothetical protein K8H88_14930, partial [Sandaracinaceae bacterium]|nr:hypothetical protein [Sandaracinaceae bacterium]